MSAFLNLLSRLPRVKARKVDPREPSWWLKQLPALNESPSLTTRPALPIKVPIPLRTKARITPINLKHLHLSPMDLEHPTMQNSRGIEVIALE